MFGASHSLIEPAVSGKVQTGQAGADEVGGGKGVSGDVGGEEEAGRQGQQTAVTGKGRTWVNAAQNKSEGPGDKNKEKENSTKLISKNKFQLY